MNSFHVMYVELRSILLTVSVHLASSSYPMAALGWGWGHSLTGPQFSARFPRPHSWQNVNCFILNVN